MWKFTGWALVLLAAQVLASVEESDDESDEPNTRMAQPFEPNYPNRQCLKEGDMYFYRDSGGCYVCGCFTNTLGSLYSKCTACNECPAIIPSPITIPAPVVTPAPIRPVPVRPISLPQVWPVAHKIIPMLPPKVITVFPKTLPVAPKVLPVVAKAKLLPPPTPILPAPRPICPPPVIIPRPYPVPVPIAIPIPSKNILIPYPIAFPSPPQKIYFRGPSVPVAIPIESKVHMPIPVDQPYPVSTPLKYIAVPVAKQILVNAPEQNKPEPVAGPDPSIPVPIPVNRYITVPDQDRILPVPVPYSRYYPGVGSSANAVTNANAFSGQGGFGGYGGTDANGNINANARGLGGGGSYADALAKALGAYDLPSIRIPGYIPGYGGTNGDSLAQAVGGAGLYGGDLSHGLDHVQDPTEVLGSLDEYSGLSQAQAQAQALAEVQARAQAEALAALEAAGYSDLGSLVQALARAQGLGRTPSYLRGGLSTAADASANAQTTDYRELESGSYADALAEAQARAQATGSGQRDSYSAFVDATNAKTSGFGSSPSLANVSDDAQVQAAGRGLDGDSSLIDVLANAQSGLGRQASSSALAEALAQIYSSYGLLGRPSGTSVHLADSQADTSDYHDHISKRSFKPAAVHYSSRELSGDEK